MRQRELAGFHTNPQSSLVEVTVVVGNATVLASKLAPHVIVRGVPLSRKLSHNI
jgi:hypothetical protein